MINLPQVLNEPIRPNRLPNNTKWLSGEGAGSWFIVEKLQIACLYRITRISPLGEVECIGHYSSTKNINLSEEYSITYPSHCSTVSIIQNKELISLKTLH